MGVFKPMIYGITVGVFCVILSACSPAAAPVVEAPAAPITVNLIREQGDFFSASGDCAYCHTGLSDQSGNDVSIDTAWRSSIMANSTRDPYYRASVRSEVLANPNFDAEIQDKCTVCHVGMAYQTATFTNQPIQLLPENGFMSTDNPLHNLAIDGVSCSLCHQIQSEGLGEASSFSGHYSIDSTTEKGSREVFGPFAIDTTMSALMSGASGFVPVEAEYTKQSETCAVCHNLFTPYITNDGQLSTEKFPEQTPQLEWLHSSYTQTNTCQNCHMPPADGAVAISNSGSPAREPFAQHIMVGGNQFLANLFAKNGDALNVTATSDQFLDTANQTLEQLTQKTANLNLNGELVNNQLDLNVSIQVLTGHKFPTSFPSRRAWLHIIVKDAGQKAIFESGNWKPDGAIIGNANDEDAAQYEPHYTLIQSPDQVQIYESIIGNPNGEVTTTLLRAKDYLKDNRLLPLGFDKTTASSDIAVVGDAASDADFVASGDTLRYQINTGDAKGPFQIQVELLYQSIGYRWGEKFRGETNNPEGMEFYGYLESTSNEPVVISSTEVEIP